jgi:hypothetical protein
LKRDLVAVIFLALSIVIVVARFDVGGQWGMGETRFRGVLLGWSTQTTKDGERDVFSIRVDEVLDPLEGEEGHSWPHVGWEVHVLWSTGSNAPQPNPPANGDRVEVFGTVYNTYLVPSTPELVVELLSETHYLRPIAAVTSSSPWPSYAELAAYVSLIAITTVAGGLLYKRRRHGRQSVRS